MKKVALFFVFMALIMLISNDLSAQGACDAKKKFEASDYLPTLSIRDSTSLYTYKIDIDVVAKEKKLLIYYMKDVVGAYDFVYTEDTKIINTKGDLLELVIIYKTKKESYFFIKGKELRAIVNQEDIPSDYFRVRMYDDNEYIFRFGEEPNYGFSAFIRQKLFFCKK